MSNFRKLSIGATELIALQETWARRDPIESFPMSTLEEWQPFRHLLDTDGLFTMNLGVWLIRSEGKIILVDSGIGFRDAQTARLPIEVPPVFPMMLAKVGVQPAEIDLVVHTHLHFDHTGWNTLEQDGANVPHFPNAKHVVQRAEWEFWTATDKRRGLAFYDQVLEPIERSGQLELFDGDYIATAHVSSIPTRGHTVGHVSYLLASEGERVYILGDAAHSPAQVNRPDWSLWVDIDKEKSASGRGELFRSAEREGALIASGHFPYPGLGYAERRNGQRVFRPI